MDYFDGAVDDGSLSYQDLETVGLLTTVTYDYRKSA